MKVSKILIAALTLTTTLFTSALVKTAQADEWDSPHRPHHPLPHRPGPGMGNDGYEGRERLIARNIHRQVYGHEILRVRQLLNLGREDRGLDIERVIVEGTSHTRRPLVVRLLVNDLQVGRTQYLEYGLDRAVFELRELHDDLGSDIRTLQVEVIGDGVISRLGAVIEREYEHEYDFGRGPIIF